MYQNIEKEHQDGFSSSRKASSKLERKSDKTTVQSIELKNDDMDIDEKIHEENPYGELYVNDRAISDIAVSNFEKIIEGKSENEDDGFKKEYATLIYGERYPCVVGKLPENIPKNRFKTTFPYNHSRVILRNKRSDYINANYIDDLNKTRLQIFGSWFGRNT